MDPEDDDIGADIRAAVAELDTAGEKPNERPEEAAPEPTEKPAAPEAGGGDPDPKVEEQVPENTEETGEAKPEPVAAAAPDLKPPTSWTPKSREKWASVDPELREEIIKREREIDLTLHRTAQDRQLSSEVQRVLSPYLADIEAAGGQPLQAVDNLLRTAATLRRAQPEQRAQMVADIIQQYDIDVEMLDKTLSERHSGTAPIEHSISRLLDQRLAPVLQLLQRNAQPQQPRVDTQALETEVSSFFNDPKNEFVNDVRQDMADILDAATAKGVVMSLQDAYKRATLLHPQIAEVLAQRQATKLATQHTQAAARAKQAAVSVSGNGAPSLVEDENESDDIRGAIKSSIRQLSR